MIANFYIISESISNETLDNDIFSSSLEKFISEYYKINEFREDNKIIIQNSIYDIVLPNGRTLADFLYSNESGLDGKEISIKKFLSSIFIKLPHEDITIEDVKDKIQSNSIENCYGIIALTGIKDIADENQIIYDKNSWFTFRRYHLGLFFGEANYFIDECKKYYPELFFHECNYDSVGKILDGFSNKIVFHLNALNDIFPNLLSEKNYNNHTELLSNFSTLAVLDETATLEGSNKDRLNFNFKNNQGEFESIVCEPHIKLCTNDSSDGHYYQNRIYFYFGKKNIQDSKILVGHIGEHL
jgi:hypothetical protein